MKEGNKKVKYFKITDKKYNNQVVTIFAYDETDEKTKKANERYLDRISLSERLIVTEIDLKEYKLHDLGMFKPM